MVREYLFMIGFSSSLAAVVDIFLHDDLRPCLPASEAVGGRIGRRRTDGNESKYLSCMDWLDHCRRGAYTVTDAACHKPRHAFPLILLHIGAMSPY
jgi:hypothetical protein